MMFLPLLAPVAVYIAWNCAVVQCVDWAHRMTIVQACCLSFPLAVAMI